MVAELPTSKAPSAPNFDGPGCSVPPGWQRCRPNGEGYPLTDTVERRSAPETVDRAVVRFAGDSGVDLAMLVER